MSWITEGVAGVLCVEAGGPTPGMGCAGRGIIAAFEMLEEKNAFEIYKPDIVLYDVLGDVVCGGFAMPIREGYAEKVFVITSGENMAIHAAANIAMAVENFADRGYASLGGIILNRRNVEREEEKVEELARDIHSSIVGSLPFSPTVQKADELQKTVLEAFPESEMAQKYRGLCRKSPCGVQQFRRREKCAVIDLRSVPGIGLERRQSSIREAQFPAPFEQGVEYAAPAQGTVEYCPCRDARSRKPSDFCLCPGLPAGRGSHRGRNGGDGPFFHYRCPGE